jgi:hypothetical protein
MVRDMAATWSSADGSTSRTAGRTVSRQRTGHENVNSGLVRFTLHLTVAAPVAEVRLVISPSAAWTEERLHDYVEARVRFDT